MGGVQSLISQGRWQLEPCILPCEEEESVFPAAASSLADGWSQVGLPGMLLLGGKGDIPPITLGLLAYGEATVHCPFSSATPGQRQLIPEGSTLLFLIGMNE